MAASPSTSQPSLGCDYEKDSAVFLNTQFGGLQTFYNIATGIVNGVQKTLSVSTTRKVDSLLSSAWQGNSFNDVQSDVTSQAGNIVLESLGGLFWIISATILIAVLIYHCSCCCCKRVKRGQRAGSSKVLLFVYIFVLISCFAFILTGTIIYQQSVTKAYFAMDTGKTSTYLIVNKVQNIRSRKSEMPCTVQKTTGTVLPTQAYTVLHYPDFVINDYYAMSGQQSMATIDWGLTNTSLSTSQTTDNNAISGIQTLLQNPQLQANQYQAELAQQQSTNNQVATILKNLATALGNAQSQTAATLTATSNKMQNNNAIMNKVSMPGSMSITNTLSAITNTMNNLVQLADKLADKTGRYAATVGQGAYTATTWGGYGGIKAAARIAVAVPAGIVLFFILVITLALTYRMVTNVHPAKRSSFSHILGHLAITGFYLTLLFSCAVFVVSIALVWFGYGFCSVCQPVFQQDFSYMDKLYDSDMDIPVVGGGNYNVKYSMFMNNLIDSTVYTAAEGQMALSTDKVLNSTNIYSTINQALASVSTCDWAFTVDQPSYNALVNQQSLLNAQLTILQNTQKTGFLPLSSQAQPVATANTVAQLNQLTSSLNTLNTLVMSINTVLAKATAQSKTNLPTVLQSDLSNQLTGIPTNIKTSSDQMILRLSNVAYQTTDLNIMWSNTGDVLCKQYNNPLQGMWMSSGMVALFMMPAALALLFGARWIHSGSVNMVNAGTDAYSIHGSEDGMKLHHHTQEVQAQPVMLAVPVATVVEPSPQPAPRLMAVPAGSVVVVEETTTSVYPTLDVHF